MIKACIFFVNKVGRNQSDLVLTQRIISLTLENKKIVADLICRNGGATPSLRYKVLVDPINFCSLV